MDRHYPNIPVHPVTDMYFGIPVTDPYRYLEERDSAETRSVTEMENACTRAFFDAHPAYSLPEWEQQLRGEKPLTDIIRITEGGGKIAAVVKLPGSVFEIAALTPDYQVDHVIVNEEMLGNRMHIFSVIPCPSDEPVYAIIGVIHGHPRCACVIWDDRQGREIACVDGHFGITWTKDGEAILYDEAVVDTENNRNIDTVCRYAWRTGEKQVIYRHPGNAVTISACEGPDGLLLTVKKTYTDDQILRVGADGTVTSLNSGCGGWNYLGERNGKAYFMTDAEAPYGRVVSLDISRLSEENALLTAGDAIPEQDCLLTGCLVQGRELVALYECDACSLALVFDENGNRLRELPLPDRFGSAMFPEPSADAGSRVYFSFQSFTIRPSIFQLDLETLAVRSIFGETETYDDITVDQCFLNARDGQRILVYLVRQKDSAKDGKTPVLMYGYGGYGSSNNPMATEVMTGYRIADWVRKGRIYAHTILRGGLEYGTAWHEAAKLGTKKNAFNDFIDIAEYLVREGWTCPSQLIATGCSNGGLLMTAVTTMRPDLFGTVIASVPHTDMLRFRNDDRGMMYITEYGDPLGSEDMFRYMYGYSPYHNIRKGTVYPWIYVQTGEMDNNVPPYHGKKFGVRLQAEADPANPVLLTVLPHGSHNRGTGDEFFRNVAMIRVFIEISLDQHRQQG